MGRTIGRVRNDHTHRPRPAETRRWLKRSIGTGMLFAHHIWGEAARWRVLTWFSVCFRLPRPYECALINVYQLIWNVSIVNSAQNMAAKFCALFVICKFWKFLYSGYRVVANQFCNNCRSQLNGFYSHDKLNSHIAFIQRGVGNGPTKPRQPGTPQSIKVPNPTRQLSWKMRVIVKDVISQIYCV